MLVVAAVVVMLMVPMLRMVALSLPVVVVVASSSQLLVRVFDKQADMHSSGDRLHLLVLIVAAAGVLRPRRNSGVRRVHRVLKKGVIRSH